MLSSGHAGVAFVPAVGGLARGGLWAAFIMVHWTFSSGPSGAAS